VKGDKPNRERAPRDNTGDDDIAMVTYRLEVGRNDDVSPKNIVGAIANEAQIDAQFIGHIKLYDNYSTVDLPEGMPKELFDHLYKVRVCQKALKISVDNGTAGEQRDARPAFKDKSGFKDKPGSKDKKFAGKKAGVKGKSAAGKPATAAKKAHRGQDADVRKPRKRPVTDRK